MIIFSLIFMAFFGFVFGFLVGAKTDASHKKYKFETNDNSAQLRKEFENFLSYDGSVQE